MNRNRRWAYSMYSVTLYKQTLQPLQLIGKITLLPKPPWRTQSHKGPLSLQEKRAKKQSGFQPNQYSPQAEPASPTPHQPNPAAAPAHAHSQA